MNLSEMKHSNHIKLLLIGSSGAGKTVFACSNEGKTFVFDFDNKLSSAAAFYAVTNPEHLKNIEYEQYSLAKLPDLVMAGLDPYYKFRMKLAALELAARDQSKPFPYETVVVDSLTLYSEAMMTHWMVKNRGVKRVFENVPVLQDYLVAGTVFKEDMNRLLSLPCNVICIAHSTTSIDEQSKEVRDGILLSGKTADHLPRIFTEVYWAYTKRTPPQKPGDPEKIEHVANTRAYRSFICRTQIPGIPSTIKLDFKVIKSYLEQAIKPKGNTQ